MVSSRLFQIENPSLMNPLFNEFVRLYLIILIFCFHLSFSISFTHFYFNYCSSLWWMMIALRLQIFQLKWNRIQFGLILWKKYVFRKRWKMIEQQRNRHSLFRTFNWFRMNEFHITQIPSVSKNKTFSANTCEHYVKWVFFLSCMQSVGKWQADQILNRTNRFHFIFWWIFICYF